MTSSTNLPQYDENLAFSIMLNCLNGSANTGNSNINNDKKEVDDDAASDCSSNYCQDENHQINVICDDNDCVEPICESEEQFNSFLDKCCQNDSLCFDLNHHHDQHHHQPSISSASSQISSNLIKCEWADCKMQFNTLSELINHVNERHLSLLNNDCKWGNGECRIPPLPSTSKATENQNNDPNTILKHVLQDHLQMDDSNLLQNCIKKPATTPNNIFNNDSQSPNNDIIFNNNNNNIINFDQMDDYSIATAHHSNPDLNPYAHHIHATAFPHLHPPSICPAATNLMNTPKVQGYEHPPKPHHHHTYHKPHYHHHPYPRPKQGAIEGPPFKCQWVNCKYADVEFDTTDSLMEHLSSEHVGSGKAEYACYWKGCNRNNDQNNVNGKIFSSRQKIMRHLQSHTGHRPFECPLCHRFFSEAATLQQHMRKHTREKPYVCDYDGCGKAFSIAGALTIHKRVHSGVKPFECTYCDRKFSESSNLKKHLRTHTGDRPFECPHPDCDKRFARPDQVTRHLNVHYKQDKSTPSSLVLEQSPQETSSYNDII